MVLGVRRRSRVGWRERGMGGRGGWEVEVDDEGDRWRLIPRVCCIASLHDSS